MGSRVLFLFLGLLLLSAELLAQKSRRDCRLPPSKGSGTKALTKYFYDQTHKKCLKFTYTGKGGNNNRFDTEKACLATCGPKGDCILSPSHGPCKESLIKYYFDKKEKKCLKFTYGGCKGNTNRFDTEKECQIVCGQKGRD
uniref:inter-alpha-trypsin inhibitor-like n=1 Tax=Euleptes europaea TaxID=460621 RepID=UPI0025401837|nr:inter-alpha-trypsin inhibitor-like [Euleptes europaea]